MRPIALALFAALAACGPNLAFQCAQDGDCTESGMAGVCQPSGFCSFSDTSCPTGQRYGDWAGDLSGACVDAIGGGPDAFSPPDAPPGVVEVSFGETGGATFPGVTTDAALLDGGGNDGASTHTSVEFPTWVGLYRFEVSAIPAGATIVGARVELSTINDGNLLTSGTAQVFRLLETWDEGTTTYTNRSTETLWTNANAEAPGSRDPNVLGEFTPATDGRYTVELPASMIQGWVADPGSNAGILVDASEGAIGHLHLGAREGDPAFAALLVVSYRP